MNPNWSVHLYIILFYIDYCLAVTREFYSGGRDRSIYCSTHSHDPIVHEQLYRISVQYKSQLYLIINAAYIFGRPTLTIR